MSGCVLLCVDVTNYYLIIFPFLYCHPRLPSYTHLFNSVIISFLFVPKVLSQVQNFDNLIIPVVDSLKYLSPLSYDMLSCILYCCCHGYIRLPGDTVLLEWKLWDPVGVVSGSGLWEWLVGVVIGSGYWEWLVRVVSGSG